MIINNGVQEKATVIGTVDTSNSMRMNLTAQSYSLILENLYKDPMGSVLRELTTNAVEAHQMANSTRKVCIQLPNPLNTDLVIRDFGIGLTDEEIEKYLNCLFSSSKGEDNNMMGGFGLGSKSPLALVDSFTLVSVKDGYQYDYMWIKEKGQIPTPIFQDKSKTTRQNGITITVPLGSSTKVPLQNLQKYVKEKTNRQLFAFQDSVRIVDDANKDYDDMVDLSDTVFTAKRVLDLDNLAIYYDPSATKTSYAWNMAASYVQIGSVIYDYNFQSQGTDLRFLFKYFSNLNQFVVCIKVPIGQLDLPMSREEVNTTNTNKTVIDAAIARADANLTSHLASIGFDPNTDAKGYYDQLKTFSGQMSANKSVLPYKLYANKASLLSKESAFVKLYKSYAATAVTLNSGNRYDTDFSYLDKIDNPSRSLLEQFNRLPKEVYRFTQLFRDGSRQSGTFPSDPSDKYAYFFTTSRLPGNIRYKDLFVYILEQNPKAEKVFLIQTPDKIDTTLIAEFTKQLNNLIEYVNCPDSVVSPLISDQTIKDYAKNLKLAAAAAAGTSSVTTKDFSPGVRYIDLNTLGHGLNSFNKKNNTYSYSELLINTNNHKLLKRIDSKGTLVPQGPEYVNDITKTILLTDTDYVALDLSELPGSNPKLTKASVDFSLKNVIIYKVPSKTLVKTYNLFKAANYKVYVTSLDQTVLPDSIVSIKAKLPKFSDITDKTSDTYQRMAKAILHETLHNYFEYYGWRVNIQEVRSRMKALTVAIAANYAGTNSDIVKDIFGNTNLVDTYVNSISASSNYPMELAVDQNMMKELNAFAQQTILNKLHTTNKSDWQDNVLNFLDSRLYSHRITKAFFSQLGFSL